MRSNKIFIRFVFFYLVFCVNLQVFSKTVFVSNRGSNSYCGSFNKPYKSLNFALSKVSEWDTCLIREGSYAGGLKVINFNKKKKIVITAYKNEKVQILPSNTKLNWQKYTNKIYRAEYKKRVLQFFVGNTPNFIASFPTQKNYSFDRRGWSDIYSFSDKQIIHKKTNQFKNLEGAYIIGSCGRKVVSFCGKIISQSNHTLKISSNAFYWEEKYKSNYLGLGKGILIGKLDFLDDKGEWFQDDKYIYFYPRKKSDLVQVRLASESNQIQLIGYNIQLNHLQFLGCKISLANASNSQIVSSTIKYTTPFFLFDSGFDHAQYYDSLKGSNLKEFYNGKGVELGGENNKLINSTIQFSWGDGITISGKHNTISNCKILNCNYAGIDAFAINMTGDNHLLNHNLIKDVGRSAVLMSNLKKCRILYNDISNAGILCDDLGLLYTYGTPGGGTEIAYNWLHDNKAKYFGVGIYLDNNHSKFNVHNNVVWNCYVAMCINQKAQNDLVYNNTFFHNKYSMASCIPDGLPPLLLNVLTYNNLTDSKLISRDCNIFYGTRQFNNKYIPNLSNQFENVLTNQFYFKKSLQNQYAKVGAYSGTKQWYAGVIKNTQASSNLFNSKIIQFLLIVVSVVILGFLIFSIVKILKVNSSMFQLTIFILAQLLLSLLLVYLYNLGILETYFSNELKLFEFVGDISSYLERKHFDTIIDFLSMDNRQMYNYFKINGLENVIALNFTTNFLIKLDVLLHLISFGNLTYYMIFILLIFSYFLIFALNLIYLNQKIKIRWMFLYLLFPSFYILLIFNFLNFISILFILFYISILFRVEKVSLLSKIILFFSCLLFLYSLNSFLSLIIGISTFAFIFSKYYPQRKLLFLVSICLLLAFLISPFPDIKSRLLYLQLDLNYVSIDNQYHNQFIHSPLSSSLISFVRSIPSAFNKVWMFSELERKDFLCSLFYVENVFAIIILLFLFFNNHKVKSNQFYSFILLSILFITLIVGWISPTILFVMKYKVLIILLLILYLFKIKAQEIKID